MAPITILIMNTIKNVHLLNLSDADRQKIEAGAALHLRMSNISFKILEVTEKGIVVRVTQGKHLSENYADKSTLVQRTRELFSKFLPDIKVHPQAIPYKANPVTEIDSVWIKKQMEKYGLRVTDIVEATGIDKTNVSVWVNGTRPMSQPVKALFYYLFAVKRLTKGLDEETLKKAGIKVTESNWGFAA